MAASSTPPDPNTLRIVNYPAEVLRTQAEPVESVTENVRDVSRRMIELMLEAPGIGLAAPQVGISWRLFVAHVPPDPDEKNPALPGVLNATAEPTVYINPELSDFSTDLEPYDEGCLSLPEITGIVRRPSTVSITATDLKGNRFTHRATGLLARCWQHEMDHLDGTLIIDKFSPMDRRRTKRAVELLEAAAKPLI